MTRAMKQVEELVAIHNLFPQLVRCSEQTLDQRIQLDQPFVIHTNRTYALGLAVTPAKCHAGLLHGIYEFLDHYPISHRRGMNTVQAEQSPGAASNVG